MVLINLVLALFNRSDVNQNAANFAAVLAHLLLVTIDNSAISKSRSGRAHQECCGITN